MSLIYVLLVAHFVGDFVLQSDWMALHKSKSWAALCFHVGVYGGTLSLALWGLTGAFWWTEPVGLFLVTNVAAHFVQDAITSRINARLWFVELDTAVERTGSVFLNRGQFIGRFNDKRHWFFVAIGVDQLLHYVTLFLTAEWWL